MRMVHCQNELCMDRIKVVKLRRDTCQRTGLYISVRVALYYTFLPFNSMIIRVILRNCLTS